MDSKKLKQSTLAQAQKTAIRYAQQKSPTDSSAYPGSSAGSSGSAGLFSSKMRQGPVPQQFLGKQKPGIPQGYPIGPSSRQGMGSRLGDSGSLNDQIQQLQRFKGSFNPHSSSTNSQPGVGGYPSQGGIGAGQRTNRSSAVGLDETNIPITDRGQAIKSARHQPKALTQMKPNLIGSEYASQPEDISGYSTAGFKNISQTS